MLKKIILSTLLMTSQASVADVFVPEPMVKTIPSVAAITAPVDVSSGEINVPMIAWAADLLTIHANGNSLKTLPGSILGQTGLRWNLYLENNTQQQLVDYISGKTPFLRCTIGMCAHMLDAIGDDPRLKPVAIYQLSWSRGGDAAVKVGGSHGLCDLKGKNIAVQAYGPHVDFMINSFKDPVYMGGDCAKLSDVNIHWYPSLFGEQSPPDALLKSSKGVIDKDIQLAFMIKPDAAKLTNEFRGSAKSIDPDVVQGGTMIISTMTRRYDIADLYYVRNDFLEKHPDVVSDFVASLMESSDETKSLMKTYDEYYYSLLHNAAEWLLEDRTLMPEMADLFYSAHLVDEKENEIFFATYPHDDPLYRNSHEALNKRIQSSLKEMGLIEKERSVAHADWEYSSICSRCGIASNN